MELNTSAPRGGKEAIENLPLRGAPTQGICDLVSQIPLISPVILGSGAYH